MADPEGDPGVHRSPHLLWAAPSTDDRLKRTPLSGYRTKKTAVWLTLECFRRKFVENRLIGLARLVVYLKNDRNGRGFAPK